MFVDIHTHKLIPPGKEIIISNIGVSDASMLHEYVMGRYFSVGIHPWDLDKKDEDDWDKLLELCRNDVVRLVGECGFDKHVSVPYERQKECFLHHVHVAEETNKPLIIHCVGYFNELFSLRKELKPEQPWIVHGFRGKPQLAEQALKSGVMLSFGKFYNPEAVVVTPLDQLFVESDESDSPVAPLYLELAELKQTTPDRLTAGRRLLGLV